MPIDASINPGDSGITGWAEGVAAGLNDLDVTTVRKQAAIVQTAVAANTATNVTAALQAELDGLHAGGGGTLQLAGGTYLVAGLVMRHRVSIRGAGMRRTILKAVSGSSALGIILINVGYAQDAWLTDLEIQGNGNAGQHGMYVLGQTGDGGNGGWWQSGMRRVHIDQLSGTADCIRFDSNLDNFLLPHQFLLFQHVNLFPPDSGRAVAALSQVGQVHWDSCTFERSTPGVGTGTNVYVEALCYAWTFTNCTFQNNLIGVHAYGAQEVTLNGCYFENIGRAVEADESARSVVMNNTHWANAGYISSGDATGALVRARNSSRVRVIGGWVSGEYSRTFVTDNNSTITRVGSIEFPPDDTVQSVGNTKQISVSGGGGLTFTPGCYTYLVNTSATAITTIEAASRMLEGERVTLIAWSGSIVLSEAGDDIYLAGKASPLTVPAGGVVTLQRFDVGKDWVLVGYVTS